MAELFARIRILDVPYHADNEYDYFVPTELRSAIRAGMLVCVPYGVGNRSVQAVVTELSESPELERRDLKPVLSLSPSGVLLDEDMLALCSFMKEHTLCTFGDAVRAMIPSAAIAGIREFFSVVPGGMDTPLPPDLTDETRLLYAHIVSRGRVPAARLVSEFGKESVTLAQSLVRMGLLQKETEIAHATNEVRRRLYSISSSISDEDELKNAVSRQRSQTQAEVLRYLFRNGETAEDDLFSETGTTRAQLSSLVKKGLITERSEEVFRNPFADKSLKADVGESPLSEEQSAAFETLNSLYESGEAKAALLHGVTGSGKTRVILAMIDRVRKDGRGAIVLVPEIALTPQMVGIFLSRYGDRVSVIHSSLSAGERYDAWRRIRRGASDIVVGTRSAVFAPVANLGLIVIDEEQEHTYKSDANPKYLAQDVARFRCARRKALMLLSSATPSVNSYFKAKQGLYTLVTMKQRYGDAVLPHVIITDMRGEPGGGTISPLGSVLSEHLRGNLARGKQSIVFLNRRGFNSFVICRNCGDALKCPNCSVSLTYHTYRTTAFDSDTGEDYLKARTEGGVLTCHYCGFRTKVPEKCPSCGSTHFHFRGYGTQLLEAELAKLNPTPRVLRMDMDTTQTKSSHDEILTAFRNKEADVLLGTQMVAKGHDFPDVTLVGVIHADGSLYLDDFRAAERTFAMLTQVIGRAGRSGDAPGTAIVQTFNPTNDIITLAANQDYEEFYRREIRVRHELVFPPYCDIAVVTLASRDETLLASATQRISRWLKEEVEGEYAGLSLIIFGPFEAPVYKVQGTFRTRVVMKCRLDRPTRAFLSRLLTEFGRIAGKRLTVSVDLNPNTL